MRVLNPLQALHPKHSTMPEKTASARKAKITTNTVPKNNADVNGLNQLGTSSTLGETLQRKQREQLAEFLAAPDGVASGPANMRTANPAPQAGKANRQEQ